MTEWSRRRRNRSEIKLLHPAYRSRFELLLHRMEARGFRPRLQGTWRSNEEQGKKFADGLSQIQRDGAHNNVLSVWDVRFRSGIYQQTRKATPASLATHVLNDDNPLGEAVEFWSALAVEAHFLGLRSGLHWGLTSERKIGMLSLIGNGQVEELSAFIRHNGRGWDPNHVEAQDWREAYGQGADYDPFKRRT